MTPDLRTRIEAFGSDLSPTMMQGTQALFAASFTGFSALTQTRRDLSYGPDERHRLDIVRQEETQSAPVLVYIHGGGFVMGDKRSPEGLPFYDNVSDFAARNGMIGVTVTYRLAPDHRWPAGPEDMATLIAWLQSNIARYGGDPAKIYLMGQSAGAVHVASYVAQPRFHQPSGPGLAGALLISCIYDIAAADANPFHKAYYGDDTAAYPACSTTDGLIESKVPVLATVSEFDVTDFQKQAASYVAAYAEQQQRFPRMHWLAGHNHLSPVLEIGSPNSTLEPIISNFVAQTANQGE
ncbi:alpha/beta hydrolase [Altericroceibacterium spongiae]|uniref:Alpha/beta hydrolase n=1 Tax=Altericroceibacterium spongiae TaxID=2320269 RepID=A0A420ERJ2_9SPHN|nr:alpha/beta hydrolase [Altericroceibacterium spongiae]RKF23308.1 alpha/beta hydrolase [Altericroceibacterium spongiae]